VSVHRRASTRQYRAKSLLWAKGWSNPDIWVRLPIEAQPQGMRRRGDLKMAMEKVPMTVEGFKKLEAELHRLKAEERPRIIQAISEARSHGDLSENAEYHSAKEAQGLNEAKVADLEDKLSRADVVDTTKMSGTTVKFGATVHLEDEDTGEKVKYKIVGDLEANVRDGLISISSPIARALIGKSKGETAEVTTPKGSRSYEVLKIEWK
jgi:transcription elongation factor GreA